jgi:Uma2 family endonuclease
MGQPAVAAVTAVAHREFTWEDFIAIEDEDDRRELVDGELVETEVPTDLHEHITAMLVVFIGSWMLERKAGWIRGSGYKVRISKKRGFMPDVQFYRQDNPARRKMQGLEEGHPDLVVEVMSPSSVRFDRIKKLGGYASIGVPEYWLIDPERQTLERLILRDGKYIIDAALEGDMVFTPDTFEGLSIPLKALWESGTETVAEQPAEKPAEDAEQET